MSLIDELRAGVGHLPPSLVPAPSEALPLLGALLAHIEHGGEAFAHAAEDGHDGFVKLFSPQDAPAEEPPAAPADGTSVSTETPDEKIARLESELAAARAGQSAWDQRTTVTPLPDESAPAPEPASTSPDPSSADQTPGGSSSDVSG